MNLKIELESNAGSLWMNEGHPHIEVVFDDDGRCGIWITTGPEGDTVCWCDLSKAVIKTMHAVSRTWPMADNPE